MWTAHFSDLIQDSYDVINISHGRQDQAVNRCSCAGAIPGRERARDPDPTCRQASTFIEVAYLSFDPIALTIGTVWLWTVKSNLSPRVDLLGL